MKFYLDTEFLEGSQKKWPWGKTKPTIDLISIGIVSENDREYYAISKDFNLKEAWNRYDIVEAPTEEGVYTQCKIHWIRNNVLKPIYDGWVSGDQKNIYPFTYKSFKYLLSIYGKSNEEIAEKVKEYIAYTEEPEVHPFDYHMKKKYWDYSGCEFYTYYGDYDWVVFCWLFGKMIDLPKGFPMYSKDLKQVLDEKIIRNYSQEIRVKGFEESLNWVKSLDDYPAQDNVHNALSDARFNKKLHEFLNTL